MTYVISDIHGSLRRFYSILDQIELRPEDELYILGDVVDRHPYGITILREIMGMSNVHMLLGNHEYMLLNCWMPGLEGEDLREATALWYFNHGRMTDEILELFEPEERTEILRYSARCR